MYWGLGLLLGTPISQTDQGRQLDFNQGRGTNTNQQLVYHTDRCDTPSLLCINPAKADGKSIIISATTIHNEILKRRLDLLDVLY